MAACRNSWARNRSHKSYLSFAFRFANFFRGFHFSIFYCIFVDIFLKFASPLYSNLGDLIRFLVDIFPQSTFRLPWKSFLQDNPNTGVLWPQHRNTDPAPEYCAPGGTQNWGKLASGHTKFDYYLSFAFRLPFVWPRDFSQKNIWQIFFHILLVWLSIIRIIRKLDEYHHGKGHWKLIAFWPRQVVFR